MKITYWKCPYHKTTVRENFKKGKTKEEREKEKKTYSVICGCTFEKNPNKIILCQLKNNIYNKEQICTKQK